jgi:hypothetical protein
MRLDKIFYSDKNNNFCLSLNHNTTIKNMKKFILISNIKEFANYMTKSLKYKKKCYHINSKDNLLFRVPKMKYICSKVFQYHN